jgi:putative hemolysin
MAEMYSVGDDGWSLRAGSLEVRLAETPSEVLAAQALRYDVFYRERQAKPTPEMAAVERDFDGFDEYADHLLVIDHTIGGGERGVIGTYRLIRKEAAELAGRFYTTDEYDIDRLLAFKGELLELGRSCVRESHRTGQTMQLLWRGIAAYVFQYDIDLMFGCASLPGTEAEDLNLPLSYLYHYHLAPPALRPVALAERYSEMNLLPPEQFSPRDGLAALPPLIKGYLRLGGFVGDGAVIDYQFNTTDVCVVVQTDLVTEKYYRHYERRERRPVLVHSNR